MNENLVLCEEEAESIFRSAMENIKVGEIWGNIIFLKIC